MSNNKLFWILGISVAVILLIGSTVFTILLLLFPRQTAVPIQTQDSDLVTTQVSQTIEAVLTQQAAETAFGSTATPEPTETETPTSTHTLDLVTPTNTFIPPTLFFPTSTPITSVCDRAQFVRDVSVQDNTLLSPGSSFVKTWRLKNIGHCTWTSNYKLIFRSGDAMDASQSIALPRSVEPNQTVDLSVAMRAPQKEGTYRGYWMLSNPSGTRFGIGLSGDEPFWVQIRVMNLADPNLDYDFAANYCRADWSSAAGQVPCPGTSSTTEGFVVLLDNPEQENRREDELALWTRPNTHSRGWISGMFPEFTIQPNHRFRATVGCLDNSKGCNVVFRLDFKNLKTGVTRNLGTWHEVYDGKVTKVDLDLSEHAGKLVRFILTVEVSGGDPARENAFWLVPGIVKIQQATPTPSLSPPSATPVPSETPTETPIATEGQQP